MPDVPVLLQTEILQKYLKITEKGFFYKKLLYKLQNLPFLAAEVQDETPANLGEAFAVFLPHPRGLSPCPPHF